MDLHKAFPADHKKATDGVWVDINGLWFKLTYYNSTVAQLTFQANVQKNKAGDDKKHIVINAMHETLIEEVVLDWKDLQENKVDVFYSKDELRRILTEYIGLDAILMEAAGRIENFKREQVEEIAEN